MTLRNLYLLSMIIFAAFILFLSIIPDVGGGVNSGISAHIIAYFMLSISTSLFIKADNYHYPLLKGAILAGTYGAIIEIVQNFIPYQGRKSFENQGIPRGGTGIPRDAAPRGRSPAERSRIYFYRPSGNRRMDGNHFRRRQQGTQVSDSAIHEKRELATQERAFETNHHRGK